jgi:hypothetical protein
MVRCIKTTSGQGDAYRDYMLATTAKSMQVRANEGDIDGWIFARVVIPGGGQAECDFVQMNLHRRFPPARTPIDPFFAKAGLTTTRQEWYARLGEMSRLIRVELWRGVAEAGGVQKGNFLRLDMLKLPAARLPEWRRLQGDWRVAGQTAIDRQLITAWQADELILPAGTSYPYAARRMIAFSDWAAIGRAPDDRALLQQALPGRGPVLLAREVATSELARSELYEVVEVVRPITAPAPAPAPPAPR